MMHPLRLAIGALTAAVLAASAVAAGAEDNWPARPVRIVVPFST